MKNFNYIVFTVFLVLVFLPGADLVAQTCTFPGGCCPDGFPIALCPGCPPCTPVPLDGGLSALLIAGVAYGAKKMRSKLN
tara:strand:- start:172 stop:411 length:240 start_codon:yes stop_codon:yes gene_type:complete